MPLGVQSSPGCLLGSQGACDIEAFPQPHEHFGFSFIRKGRVTAPPGLKLGEHGTRLEVRPRWARSQPGTGMPARAALAAGPRLGSDSAPVPALTSRHHKADVLHGEYRQLFLRVHPDDPIGQPVHGEDAAAWGLVAVIGGPVMAVCVWLEACQLSEHRYACKYAACTPRLHLWALKASEGRCGCHTSLCSSQHLFSLFRRHQCLLLLLLGS